MTEKHRLVVSSENGPYHGWQCKLFYFSCVTRLNHHPVFIVHSNGESLHPDFIDLAGAGATVRTAPSYRQPNYPAPRNTIGTILAAAQVLRSDQWMVLCDPDFVFLRPPVFPEQLAANIYPYMNYDRAPIEAAALRVGVERKVVAKTGRRLCVGVPYVIPVTDAAVLGEEWLRVFDAFHPAGREWDDIWQDIMYAFGLATLKLGWRVRQQDQVDLDGEGAVSRRAIIHYCWGTAMWNKRNFYPREKTAEVWEPACKPAPGSVLEELFAQIRAARQFYRKSIFRSAPRCGSHLNASDPA
jgi:hypothetical protein